MDFLWLYRLQQRLSITPAEGTALLVAGAALVSGLVVRELQAHSAPASAALLVEDDRLAAIDRAAAEAAAASPAPAGVVEATAAADPPPAAPARRPRRAASGLPAPHSVAINSAPASELERLPRIGPALAGRIVEHRSVNGPFESIEALESVRGIGPRMLEQIRPFVTL